MSVTQEERELAAMLCSIETMLARTAADRKLISDALDRVDGNAATLRKIRRDVEERLARRFPRRHPATTLRPSDPSTGPNLRTFEPLNLRTLP